jgi:hypothetical protein
MQQTLGNRATRRLVQPTQQPPLQETNPGAVSAFRPLLSHAPLTATAVPVELLSSAVQRHSAAGGAPVVQRVRYVENTRTGETREVADNYQLGPQEAFVDTSQSRPTNLRKEMATLTFELPPAQLGQQAFYKGTSMGSMRQEGGIATAGLDPAKGGMGGGSGVWEGNAPDRYSNLGWTTLATNVEATEAYARGFEKDRRKHDAEIAMMKATGKLNAKWIGVTLRVLADAQEMRDHDKWRRDPGSGSMDNVWQTSEVIPVEKIEVQSITLMMSPESMTALREHLAANEGVVNTDFLDALLAKEYFIPGTWDPRQR